MQNAAPTTYLPVPPALSYDGTLVEMGSSAPTSDQPVVGPSYEERYRIEGGIGHGLFLQYQLPVRVWLEGAEFVAEQPGLRLHAFGQNQTEAILNLRDEIADHFRRLQDMGEGLSPVLKRDRALLRKLLGQDA